MEFLQLLGGAVVLGSALGTTVASLFAYRQKSLVTMLRESNKDYKDRVDQLVADGESKDTLINQMRKDIDQLKREKTLPLENLTRLVISQNAETNKSIMALTNELKKSRGKK